MKNIIFDLGGVVVDWSPQRVLNEYPGDRELPVSLFQKGFFQQYWTEFDRGTMTQEELICQMAEYAGRPVEECRKFIEFIKLSLVDIPRTVELIQNLSAEGYKLYCLSNMSVEFYDYLKIREVFGYFDGQVISALEKVVKPEDAIYRLILDRFNLIPEETLFIDDLQHNLDAANEFGIQTVNFSDREKGYRMIEDILRNDSL